MREIVFGNETMKAAYEKLLAQFEAAHGPVTEAADSLLLKLGYLEALHQQAVADLQFKGLREKYQVSSFSSGTRENKALGQMMKIQAQQVKLLKELKLLPGGRTEPREDRDDGSEQDIDDY